MENKDYQMKRSMKFECFHAAQESEFDNSRTRHEFWNSIVVVHSSE